MKMMMTEPEKSKYRKNCRRASRHSVGEECLGKGVSLVKGSGKVSRLFFISSSTDSLKICLSPLGIKLAT